ncbi:MAG: flagellar basal-body protein FlbY [Oceanicaulis sp.]
MTELAANTPSERAQALIRLTARLTALLEQETALFEARKPHEAVPLQAEKTKLATLYRAETARAAKDPSRLSGVEAALKAKLRETTTGFEAALRRNGAAVEALKTLTEGLVKALADEAARQKAAQAGYGPNAARGAGIGALALNRTA